jgi:hypothetical protein
MHLHLHDLGQWCWYSYREVKQGTLPKEKSTTKEMLLAHESRARHNIELKNREKRGERTQTLTKPDLLDSSLS